MAIDLLNRLISGKVNNTVSTQSETPTMSDSAQIARIVRSVYALKAGDTLQGELLSAKGTDISLLLGKTVTLNAKLDKELTLTPGQMMSFSVNSNKNGKLSLSPLFANTGMEQNAIKALDAAAVPVTDKTLAMAEELMKQGMPINKQTLSTVFRQMGMYPEAEIRDIVLLNKMNIPVTSENVSMMHLYQANEQYLFSDLQGLSAQVTDMLVELMDEQASLVSEGAVVETSGNMPVSSQNSLLEVFVKEFVQIFSAKTGTEAASGEEIPVAQIQENAGSEKTADNFAENISFQNEMQIEKEGEILHLIRDHAVRTPEGREILTQNLFDLLKEQILMKPEDVQSAEYVKEFYETLDKQLSSLQELIKTVGKENSALSKEVGNVKSNIQFMNQINELYHYVQLPIKMNNAQAKGDLYVYKRKNAKTGDDGRLTALLHLSMPTLGNMDVFLSLENQKLSTRFCMEKEEMIDFIEGHMDQLNERLMKKGYQVQSNVTSNMKEDKTVIENILENEVPIPIMTSQSFDARC